MFYGTKSIRRHRVLFLTVMLIVFCVAATIVGVNSSVSDNKAEAALPAVYSNLITNGGLEIHNTKYFTGTYICDNLLTSLSSNGVGTTYGDYLFTNIDPTRVVCGVQEYGKDIIYTDTVNGTQYQYSGFSFVTSTGVADSSITITVPVLENSNLYKAINDDMLNVQISAYNYQLYLGNADGQDTARSTLTYNDGSIDTSIIKEGVKFPARPEKEIDVAMSSTLTLPDKCANGAYVKLVLDNFVQGGNNFAMIITKFAFRISVSLKTDIVFESQTSADTTIVDIAGTRDTAATSNMVKKGDIILIDAKLQKNENFISVFEGIPEDTVKTGRYYRNLFLNAELGTARNDYPLVQQGEYYVSTNPKFNSQDFVSWSYGTSLTRIYYFKDEKGVTHDLRSGYSAMTAAFYVNDTNLSTISINCSMKSYTGAEILSGNNYVYVVDTTVPNSPVMDASTIFYKKYIQEKNYYTKIAGYNTETNSQGDTKVRSVTIGSVTEGSDASMSPQTLSPQGLSSEIVYYKVTKLENDPDYVPAANFTREEATGVFCIVSPVLSLVGGEYRVTDIMVLYEGIELMLREGTNPENYTYPEQGIFKVEFFSYDYVGNKCSTASAVVIRVDVADYTFDVITKIGSTEVTTLTSDTFSLFYYAINEKNQLESRGNATFKRGDKVVIKLDFTATGYSNYILTYFQTPAGDAQNTSTYPYDLNDAVYLTNEAQSKTIPTFVLGNSYSGNDKADNRKLIFTFKTRALINVTNLRHIYAPDTPRAVSTMATIGGKKVTNVTILTTYSETKNGNYRAVSSDFPMNAGTYYYKCELTSTNYHGFTTGEMVITPATPAINELRVSSINYGDSLDVRNTIYKAELGRYVMSDSIFCSYTYFDEISNTTKKISVYNRSSDGVYGYFSIVEPSAISENYKKPSAGTLKVKVMFTPILMVDPYTPYYDEVGNFILNRNYFPVTISDVPLTVNHSYDVTCQVANKDLEGNVVLEYTGGNLNIKATVGAVDAGRPIDLTNYLLYSFTEINKDNGIYTPILPVNAGIYKVKFRLNTSNSNCNYAGEWEQTLIINPRPLKVWADDMIMNFQRETKPAPYAEYFYAGGSTLYYNLNYRFEYYYYDSTKNNAEMAVEENRVPDNPLYMFNNLPYIAGEYLVKIIINESNYNNESDCFIKYIIKKVTDLSGDYIQYEFPALNWTNPTSGYHLNYLQPLKAISIMATQTTTVKYYCHYIDLGKVKYQWMTIDGYFMVAHSPYTGDYSAEDLSNYIENEKNYDKLPAGKHSMYLYFIPKGDNIKNFNLLGMPYSVNVGKAQPIFNDVTAEPITYGKRINGIEDLVLSKAVKCKLYAENGTVYYKTLDESEYTYSLYSISNPLLSAGANNVIITFKPVDNANFESANGTVSVFVNKKTLSVSFAENQYYNPENQVYVYPYKGYVNAIRVYNAAELVNSQDNPGGVYSYYRYIEGIIFGQAYTDTTLVSGKYAVKFIINDNNYKGENYFITEIIKDSLKRNTDPAISQAATAASYGKAMNMVVFSGGSMLAKATNTRVSGTYYFNYPAGTLFDKVGTQALKIKFVPDDTDNYNVYEGEGELPYILNVNVSRADISEGITITVPNDYEYGDLSFDWAFSDTSYTTPIYTDGVNFSNVKIDESYTYLSGALNINNRPMSGYFSAGDYQVTFTVDETKQPYYTGKKTVSMTVAKKKALLVAENNAKPFDNKMQSVTVGVYLAVVEGENVVPGEKLNETVQQIFYKNGVKMNTNPSAIGTYTVDIILQSTNYEYYYGSHLTDILTIRVDDSQIIINNLNQVYSMQRALGISLGANNAVYTVKYYDEFSDIVYDVMPVNAGIYRVWLVFDSASNNGYSETIIYTDNLIIEKYTAKIISSDIISSTYSGISNPISVRTEPYNLNVATAYRKQGDTEFTETEVLDANIGEDWHEVKFVINNSNYKGEKIIRYYIMPAPLTIEKNPVFNNYVYNTDTPPALSAGGKIRFGYDTYIEKGQYSIPLENIKYLDAGTYNVTYKFTSFNEFDEIETNYQVAEGVCKLVIEKQIINPDYIIIPDDINLNVKYNAGYHYAYAVLCKGENCSCKEHYDQYNIDKDGLIFNIKSNNKDFVFRIKYNGSSTPARSLGEYTLNAEIVSKNYAGGKTFAQKLFIEQGEPQIRTLPKIKPGTVLQIIKDGENFVYPEVKNSDLIPGEAYIKNTSTGISGSYAVAAGQSLKRANINYLNILFTPADNNFKSVTIKIEVNVLGINPLAGAENASDWTDKTINIDAGIGSFAEVVIKAVPKYANPSYGASLADFELYFINADDTINTDYSDFGMLSFVNSSLIPSVGEKVAVRFVPFESKNATFNYIYNVMNGYIEVEIAKIAHFENWSYSLKGFENKTLNEDMVFEISDGNQLISLDGGILTIYTDSSKTAQFDMDRKIFYAEIYGQQVYISYFSNNYATYESYINIDVYGRIAPEDIYALSAFKEYGDGAEITLQDLDLQINGVIGISAQHISLHITDSGNNPSNGRNIGLYDILIVIDNGQYYGTKLLEGFAVVKKDISQLVFISASTSVYGSFEMPDLLYKGEIFNPAFYERRFKKDGASEDNYSANMGEDAGIYNIKYVIDCENYIGTKVFTYKINPVIVRVTALNREVIYNSLESIQAPPVEIKSAVNEDVLAIGYTLYYYNEKYTITPLKPSDAGVYTVRIVLNDNNYAPGQGLEYVEFFYTILKSSVSITTMPSVLSSISPAGNTYNIKYGQSLSDIKLNGGTATKNNVPVSGVFSVKNGSFKPDAGNYIITVLFKPYNTNYDEASANYTIIVVKGDAQVIVDNLYSAYDGQSKKNKISVTVQPSGVKVAIVYTNSKGEIVTEPTNAGTYYISAQSLNNNYDVSISKSADGSTTPRLVITKAKVQQTGGKYKVTNPIPLSITCGDSLAKSSLSKGDGYGEVYYEGFAMPVPGSFTYLQSALIFNLPGEFPADYVFTPNDVNNFDTYNGVVDITVNKAYATISVSGTQFVYGEGFTMPKFTTSPAGLLYEHNIPFKEYTKENYLDEDIIPAGTYYFRVWITSPNYAREENYLEFSIYVAKKNIDMSFINDKGEVVTQYVTTYGAPVSAKTKLYGEYNSEGKKGYLQKDAIVNNVKITDRTATRYISTDRGRYYDSHVPPVDRGGYEVTVSIINDNYTASATVVYLVNRGVIEDIIFNTHTLENQIYGNVVAPIITTKPSKIRYYIIYQGHGLDMPQDAGIYNIMVYFDDDNYEKKQISAMFKINKKQITVVNIVAEDKVYDGVPSIKISGKLSGVRMGDEVILTLSATTAENAVNIGYHYVDITEYSIKGLQAGNYVVEKPIFYEQVNIKTKVINAAASNSYVTSGNGFRTGTSMKVTELDIKENKTNIISKAMGIESKVVGFTLLENGQETIMQNMVKVYIALPKEYIGMDMGTDFTVEGAGALAGQTILFTQEGDYITFSTTSSGSIVFNKVQFKYTFAVTCVSIVIILVGIIVLVIMNPVHTRNATSDRSREKAIIKRIKRGY